jgi:hypothetical protein
MNTLLQRLNPNERRGSKPRCHCLTHGPAEKVAARLSTLIEPWGQVTVDDQWMPQGFGNKDETQFEKAQVREAQLHQACRLIPDAEIRSNLAKWWLAVESLRSRTPNFDIASTCRIEGKKGLLLVEAKAHDEELNTETAGKRLRTDASENSKRNHDQISVAIEAARQGLSRATSLSWCLSRDSHYQISNRFAWSWKMTELGFPVVLVYLGFLKAEEMKDQGKPFADCADWERLVKAHSQPLFPPEVWNQRWVCNGQPFVPLIRSKEQKLPPNAE